jgi:protein KRI1
MEKKREEVKRLKALKMREIRRKLEVIGREWGILGAKSSGKGKDKALEWDDDDDEEGAMGNALNELDLEGDWDPEKHDQQMAGLYGGDGDNEGGWQDHVEVDNDGKPIWKDDIDIGDIPMSDDGEENIVPVSDNKDRRKKKKKKKGGNDDYEDVGVDIDAMDADVQAIKKELGEEEDWDGTEEMRKRKLDEYMEEIYNLDFNDMVRVQSLFQTTSRRHISF